MVVQLYRARSEVEPAALQSLVAIPAYNEDRFIGSVVLKLRADGYSVLVVDDGSCDRTAQVAESAGAEVIRHPENRGKTAAVRTAFRCALERHPRALVLLDGDGQHEPAEVAEVVGPVLDGRADMVVGSRFAGEKSKIPRWRVIGQHALTVATNVGSGLPLSDSQSGFRAFSYRAVQAMHFRRSGFSVESEMQFQARTVGLKVLEVPIHVHYELPLKRSPIRQGLDVLDGVLRLVAQHRPLLFFSAPGLLMLLAGVALGLYVVKVYEATLTLAIGYALVTMLLCTLGLLSAFVGVVLHSARALFEEFSRPQGSTALEEIPPALA